MVEFLDFLGDSRPSHETIVLLVSLVAICTVDRLLRLALFGGVRCASCVISLTSVLLEDGLMTFVIGVQITAIGSPSDLSARIWTHGELLAMCCRRCCHSRRGLGAWAHRSPVLNRPVLRYLRPTPDQVRDAYWACRVHLILPKARVELILGCVLIAVDLLLTALDATKITLGLLGWHANFRSIAGSFVPHEARLRELISVGYEIARDPLRLI